jgi:xanthine dehydrogenase YagS FAD-binding subunit
MKSFEYASPTSTEQAVSLLAREWGQAEILAGGTDLLALMKDDIVAPRRLVNIKGITHLEGVSADARGLRIGALTRLSDLAGHAEIQRGYPALAEALIESASPQIRNMATLGGNLCQRPRCWYFRNGFGLLPEDETGKELIAQGENRYHAILGNDGPAKFVSPSTIVPALIAYGATLKLESPKGRRELPLEEFYRIPTTEAEREHNLQPYELVTEVSLPPAKYASAAHYEIRHRQAFDWPLAVAAVVLRMNGRHVQSARIVMGQVAPVPWLAQEAAQALTGKIVSAETAKLAAAAAVRNAKPLSQNAFKVRLARVAVERAILKAASGGTA